MVHVHAVREGGACRVGRWSMPCGMFWEQLNVTGKHQYETDKWYEGLKE